MGELALCFILFFFNYVLSSLIKTYLQTILICLFFFFATLLFVSLLYYVYILIC